MEWNSIRLDWSFSWNSEQNCTQNYPKGGGYQYGGKLMGAGWRHDSFYDSPLMNI